MDAPELRYADVIRLVFLVLHLLLIIFTSSNLCCLSKSNMKHLNKIKTFHIENMTSLDLIMVT